MKKTLFFVLAVLLLASCEKPGPGNNHSAPYIIKNAVTDIDGNTYDAVKIGNQVWMAENLKTTRYANGDIIPHADVVYSDERPFRYYPDGNIDNVATYGYLYNWLAVMHNASSSDNNPSGVQGICPKGWHVPSDAEWTQLTDYVSSQSEYRCEECEECIAKALASTTGWDSSTYICAVGNNPSANNATGFSAVPAVFCLPTYFPYIDHGAYFWSATQNYDFYAWFRQLDSDASDVYRGDDAKGVGFSVRCLRD